MDVSRLLSSEHWFNPNPGPPSLVYLALAFVFAVVLGASIYLYLFRNRLFGGHKLKARIAEQIAIVGVMLGLTGLILVVLRFLSVPYLSARVLVYLVVIALVAAVAYYVYYFLRIFPSRIVEYEAQALRKRYLPKPIAPSSRASKKRTKRRR